MAITHWKAVRYLVRLIATFLLGWMTACGPKLPDEVELAMQHLPDQLDFNTHVKPILSDRCFSCHGPDNNKREAGLRLDVHTSALAELPEYPGHYAIKAGDISASQLAHRILSDKQDHVMPPPESELHLTDREKAILLRWIEQGAEYKPHWAFIPPSQTQIPPSAAHPIDHFIQQSIKRKGWKTAPEAEKETLLRRLSFDLTGLPPSLEEVDAFLSDSSADAYEKVVNRLLSSPHFGERMATDWMDVARFADTHGYTVDRFRDMSPWRDWIIDAFNDNMPYDQFIHWQMAGDLIPQSAKSQILATGFNRNHQQNMEGGIVPEEFRIEYVADRTNTLGTAFLGLTMECARCHDHKFDPISQKNYYELFSFFNQVNEAGQISWDNAMPVPTMLLTDDELDKTIHFLEQKIGTAQQELEQIDHAAETAFQEWLIKEDSRANSLTSAPQGLIGRFSFEGSSLTNSLPPHEQGGMKQQGVQTKLSPTFTEGKLGQGLLLDGDAWLDAGGIGAFDRSDPFSVGMWTKIPAELTNGVLFHKGEGALLYNFRGLHLALKDNRLELLMARTTPDNAIIEYAEDIPRDQWVHVMMTYDGSSSAAGLKAYVNGQEVATEVENDHLYKSILFNKEQEPGIQIGARWRGTGIKGAVVDEVVIFERELSQLEVLQLADEQAFEEQLGHPTDQLNLADKQALKQYFLATRLPKRAQQLKKLQAFRQSHGHTVDTVQEVMVVRDRDLARKSFILQRGQYNVPGEEVFPNTPESLLPFSPTYPRNRWGLARWLTDPTHPLTARVAINRLWQQFFGRGLVRTSEDFGNQGELPSHPELLDWLAIEFIDSGWDIKRMAKLIVMSATYRQSSIPPENIQEEDPENIFLARGPSARLTAEMIRDNALAASGLLNQGIGGPSSKPYQPKGLWTINGGTYVQDSGNKLYRRSLYTFWRRTIPNPTQATFDAPSRANCSVRRQKTSTPLQALVLLNDPVYVEAAKVLGESISSASQLSDGIRDAFRLLTGRMPQVAELQLLQELQATERAKFVQHPDKQLGWLRTGEYEVTSKIDPAILAANTVVASTILNADATIMKR
ncbi:MAG: DUF1553 domain-containing protein [Bacteroidota bacterium]